MEGYFNKNTREEEKKEASELAHIEYLEAEANRKARKAAIVIA